MNFLRRTFIQIGLRNFKFLSYSSKLLKDNHFKRTCIVNSNHEMTTNFKIIAIDLFISNSILVLGLNKLTFKN